jgi:hypothetical protein
MTFKLGGYRVEAHLLAISEAMIWMSMALLWVIVGTVTWGYLRIALTGTVPNVNLMLAIGSIGAAVVAGLAYHWGVPRWQRTYEAWWEALYWGKHGL